MLRLSPYLKDKASFLKSHDSKARGENGTNGSCLCSGSSWNGYWERSAWSDGSLSRRLAAGDRGDSGDIRCRRRCVGDNRSSTVTMSWVALWASTSRLRSRFASSRIGGLLRAIRRNGCGDRRRLRHRDCARAVWDYHQPSWLK